MSLVAKLSCVTALGGAGVGVPMYYGLGSECSRSSVKQWVNFSSPLLTCRGTKTHIDIFLVLKNTGQFEGDDNSLYLRGVDVNRGQELDWEEKVNGRERAWRLTIYKSGRTHLGRLDGSMVGTYNDEEINCNGNVFVVQNWTFPPVNGVGGTWENDVALIKFELAGDCKITEERRECPIKVVENIGLKLSPKCNPKAIFCKSSS